MTLRRYLEILIGQHANNKYQRIIRILARPEIRDGMRERSLVASFHMGDGNDISDPTQVIIRLYGYDGGQKYQTNRVAVAEIKKIFKIIDRMPMRKQEMAAY